MNAINDFEEPWNGNGVWLSKLKILILVEISNSHN